MHQGHKNILVNLANVTHVDSAGLGELVGAYTTVTKAGGSMKLVNLTKRLHDLLAITKLLTVFDTFDSEQDALKAIHLDLPPSVPQHERRHVVVLGRARRERPDGRQNPVEQHVGRAAAMFVDARQQPLFAKLVAGARSAPRSRRR